MKYKQAIRVNGSVDDIMKLPCVRSCTKVYSSTGMYYKFGFYPLSMVHSHPYNQAVQGDWICQNQNGKWDVLSNEEYRRNEVQG